MCVKKGNGNIVGFLLINNIINIFIEYFFILVCGLNISDDDFIIEVGLLN